MLLYPKDKKKRNTRRSEQTDRMKTIAPVIQSLDCDSNGNHKCRAFWLNNTGNLILDRIEICHCMPRSVHHPERDYPWNLISFRKFVHDLFDGRGGVNFGLNLKETRIYILEKIQSVHPEDFRWSDYLDYLHGYITEEDLNQVYKEKLREFPKGQ